MELTAPQQENVPAGYKRTEVGVIPEDWEVKLLPQVCRFRSGKAHEQFVSKMGEYVCVNSKFISSDGKVGKHSTANFCPAHPGDVMMVMSDLPNGKALAKTFFSDRPNYYAVNQRVCALTAFDSTSSKYLFYRLNRNPYFLKFDDGVSQTHLLNHVFLKCPVPLPPTKAEQEAIAEALSDADAWVASLEQLIKKKRQIKQGAMQSLLTGKRRLPGFSGKWEERRLEALADIRSGGTPSTTNSSFWGGSISWCTPTDITALHGRKHLETTERSISSLGLKTSSAELLPEGTVIMTTRATIGECAIAKVPVTTNQGFKNFIPYDHVDGEFLYYLLTTQRDRFISLCAGSTFLEIGKAQLRQFIVKLPGAKAEQTAIATVLSDMDAEIDALETKLAKARQIKQGMMQELLTGKKRLI